MGQLDLMKLVAYTAVDTYVKSNSVVALGTGRTSSFAVERLAELLKSKSVTNITAIPTSNRVLEQVRKINLILPQAIKLGIPLTTLDEVVGNDKTIDVALDGADSVDKDLNLIKGGGGACFNEYLVEQYAKKLIIMVDESKLTNKHLLESFVLPVEIIKHSHVSTCKQIYKMFKEYILDWKIRKNPDGTVFLTDNNNVLMDVQFKQMKLQELNRDLKLVHGVVCTGLFLNMVTKCLVARGDNTVYTLEKNKV